jgi:S1-C subfamily serine protease
VGFAVPVNIAKRIVPQLIRSGVVTRPTMDLNTRDVALLRNEVNLPVPDGAMVWQIARGGSGATAGLRGVTQDENGDWALGDIIVGIDGEKVGNSDDVYRLLEKHQVGQTVSVEIVRNGRRLTVPVRLSAPADNRRLRR